MAKLEAAAGGRKGPLVSIVLGGKSQADLDAELAREDQRVAEAKEAGRKVIVIRIGPGLKGWRDRLAARGARGDAR